MTYESSLREKCKGISQRGTASSALKSEYFMALPYACDPLSLPKYLPNKEIDVKHRGEARRKRSRDRLRESEMTKNQIRIRKALNAPSNVGKLLPKEEVQHGPCHTRRNSLNEKTAKREPQKPSSDALSGISDLTNTSQGETVLTGPIQAVSSSNFSRVKNRKDDTMIKRSYSRSGSRRKVSALHNSSIVLEPSTQVQNGISEFDLQRLGDGFRLPNSSFDISEFFHSRDLSVGLKQRGDQDLMGCEDVKDRVEFSGPILMQSQNIQEMLQRNENHIRPAVRRSRLDRTRGMKG